MNYNQRPKTKVIQLLHNVGNENVWAGVKRIVLRTMVLILALIVSVPSTLAKQQAEFVVPKYDLLALDDGIRDLLDREVKTLPTKKQRLSRLHDIFYQPYYYNIQYEPFNTLTAVETFYRGEGNCISLANLFIAAARYVGLDAKYQIVRANRQWRPREEFYELPGHINVVVDFYRERAEIEFNRTFYDNKENLRIVKRVISDKQAKAEFLNNMGVDRLHDKKYDEAIAYFKAAAKSYRNLDFVFSNMGVAYKYQGDYKSAEVNYLKALAINADNPSTINNIFILYRELGDATQSQRYARRAEKYARKNPYYLDKLANRHIDNGDYQKAVKLLKKAIRIFQLEPDFHHNLAIAHYFQNNITKSKRALRKAIETTDSEEFKTRYQRKLDALATLD